MTHNFSFRFRKQVVLLVALLLIPSAVKAFVVKSGDVWYDINGTATVVADDIVSNVQQAMSNKHKAYGIDKGT